MRRLLCVALTAALLGAAVGACAWSWAFGSIERYGWTVVVNPERTGVGVRWGSVDRSDAGR